MNIPSWIKIDKFDRESYLKTLDLLKRKKLNTVCEEANCPNRYECFSKKTATFMILGKVCTRNCKYCNILKGVPQEVDEKEAERISEAVQALRLKYVVITCVTRDDLSDGGAEQFANVIRKIKEKNQSCKVEVLISDLKGNWNSLRTIINAKPDVINHNIETIKRIFPSARPMGNYDASIRLLRKIKEIDPLIVVKSGFMTGLGETEEEIYTTIKELKKNKCEIITIGQYLQPNKNCLEVQKFYKPEEFNNISEFGKKNGVEVIAGPLVRSSYKAKESLEKIKMDNVNKWRLIRIIEEDGRKQMAIDEAIAIARSEEKVPNTLRFYTWKNATITIGNSQKIDLLDIKKIKENGFDYVRRPTGGTAVLHKNDLTYAIIVGKEDTARTVVESYKQLSQGLVKGLVNMGVDATYRLIEKTDGIRTASCYSNENEYDIVVCGKKISGNAQGGIKNAVLQHGTIIIKDNLHELIDCLKYDDLKKQKLHANKKEKIVSLQELGKVIDLRDLENNIVKGFQDSGISFIEGELTLYEKELADKLYSEKYNTDGWNIEYIKK